MRETLESQTKNSKALRQSAANVVKSLEDLSGRLQATQLPTNIIETKLNDAVGRLDAVIAAHAKAQEQIAQSLQQSAENVAKELQNLSTRLQSMPLPTNLIEDRLDASLAQLDAVIGEHAKAQEKATDSLRITSERLGSTAASLASKVEVVGTRLDAFDRLQKQLDSAAASIHVLNRAIESNASALQSFGQRSTQDAERFGASIARYSEAFARHATVLSELATRASEDASALRRHRVSAEEDLEKARAATAQLHSSLASLANLIVEKLGEPKHA
jgi:chromosome segregation ATPase